MTKRAFSGRGRVPRRSQAGLRRKCFTLRLAFALECEQRDPRPFLERRQVHRRPQEKLRREREGDLRAVAGADVRHRGQGEGCLERRD